MTDRILVRFLDGDEYAWVRLGSDERAERGPASAFAASAADREVIAIVPGTDTLLTSAEVPSTSNAVIDKALPFAVEERLVNEPEDVAFAYAAADDPLTQDVAAASAATINGIIEVTCR